MKAYIFPGQGSQFPGMGKDLYQYDKTGKELKKLFEQANTILGFPISDILFEGAAEDLEPTNIAQPAIFIHSVVSVKLMGELFAPDMVAGHSLGEFSALVAAKSLSFEDGLKIVIARAEAMQNACKQKPGTMAAIVGLENKIVEKICSEVAGVVVPANYNCPKQLVISGEVEAVKTACTAIKLKKSEGVRVLMLNLSGAFHSPLMESAKKALEEVINKTTFKKPICPIYQNINALPTTDITCIKNNLIAQLTGSVKWSQSIEKMITDGALSFTAVGPGNVLQGLVNKIKKNITLIEATTASSIK